MVASAARLQCSTVWCNREGEAEPHHHETEHQIIDLLRGEGDVSLGEDSPVRCTAGAIVRIPPRLRHFVVDVGAEPLKMIVIYSPPIPPHA